MLLPPPVCPHPNGQQQMYGPATPAHVRTGNPNGFSSDHQCFELAAACAQLRRETMKLHVGAWGCKILLSWLHACCCCWTTAVTLARHCARATTVDHWDRLLAAAAAFAAACAAAANGAGSAAAGRHPSRSETSEAAGWGCSVESAAAPRTAAAKAPRTLR